MGIPTCANGCCGVALATTFGKGFEAATVGVIVTFVVVMLLLFVAAVVAFDVFAAATLIGIAVIAKYTAGLASLHFSSGMRAF